MGIRASFKKLFDQFGRTVDPKLLTRRPDPADVVSVSINDRWSDYPDYDLTPERLASFLREADAGDPRQQAQIWEAIQERDLTVGTHMQTRTLAIQGTEFEWQPPDDSPQAKAAADLVTKWAAGLDDWDDIIADGLDAIGQGYSIAENIWDYSMGQAQPAVIRHVPAKLCTWSNSLTPRIVTAANPYPGIELEPWKFWYNRYKAKSGDDFRGGLGRGIMWCYLFKSYTLKDWISFAEVYGMPLRLGKYPAGASAADKSALLRALRSLGTDAAGIISQDTDITFVEAMKAAVSNVYEPMIALQDRYMQLRILGQTLTSSGSDGGGSRALGEVHDEVRGDIMRSDIRALTGSFRRDVLRPLVGFNLGWDVPVPIWHFHTEPAEDEVALAAKYKTLVVDLGYPVSIEHLGDRFKIPAPAAGETVLRPPTANPFAAPAPDAPPADPTAGDAEVIADQATTVQDTALNGAQVTALQGIVQAVADGMLPAATALQLILVSFPGVTEQQARAIMGPMTGFEQAKPAPSLAASDREPGNIDAAQQVAADQAALQAQAAERAGKAVASSIAGFRAMLENAGSLEAIKKLLDDAEAKPETSLQNTMADCLALAGLAGAATATGEKK